MSVKSALVCTIMDGSSKTVKEDSKHGEAAVHGPGETRGSWLKRVSGCIPQVYRNELVQLFKLAGPVVRLTHQNASKSSLCVI